MSFASILSTIFSGGITGVIGSIVTGISNYKLKKLEYEHEEKMQELRTKLIAAQTQQTTQITKETQKTISDIADGKIKEESYKLDTATYVDKESLKSMGFVGKIVSFLLGLVDFMRGLIRPGSTIFFELYMFFVWLTLYKMVNGFSSIPTDQIVDLFKSVTLLLLYVGSTCVTWWFGSRHVDKYMNNWMKK